MLNEYLKVKQDAENLVREYIETGDESLKEQIVRAYINLVRHIVGRLNIPEGWILKKEDLYQYGVIGLLDALERYKLDYGVTFKTFAYKRIYGEIVDAIRREMTLNKDQVKSITRVNDAVDRLRAKLGREPSVDEICKEAKITEDEYFKIQRVMDIGFNRSLEEPLSAGDKDGIQLKDKLSDEQGSLEEELERKDLRRYLKKLIKGLGERERLVLALYFYEELTLADIGLVLGISESRVSQILNDTLKYLRKRIEVRSGLRR
ncbi:MAG: FliA/WhiG family RNA polymerase sigma factor [Candidatus Marinimicrobia bacterium]|nr:FliA/WhiG family RNA polymerase sigma factor [Candidatus Neomarinimicrobiota bacterium]